MEVFVELEKVFVGGFDCLAGLLRLEGKMGKLYQFGANIKRRHLAVKMLYSVEPETPPRNIPKILSPMITKK